MESIFRVGDRVKALACPNGFPKPTTEVSGLVVRDVRLIESSHIAPYYRVAAYAINYPAPVEMVEGAERFFEHEN